METKNLKARLAFIESENWDPLWSVVGQLIGIPVERLVISTAQKATRGYIRRLITPELREMFEARHLDIE